MTAGRSPSPLRHIGDGGADLGGVIVTDLDLERLTVLARWYCLSAAHVARRESPKETWHPALAGAPNEFDARVHAVRRRLTRLGRIAGNGKHAASLVGNAALPSRETGWFATPYGGTAAGMPWRMASSVSPFLANHAFAAADIGLQMESLRIPAGPPNGFRVLAEREIRTRVDQFGDDVIPEIGSKYRTDSGSINKSPDLAIMDHTGTNYVAVEVERDPRRPLKSYRDKLTAYQGNPAVLAVWYLCDTQAVASRVGRAANQLFGAGSGFPLRIRTLDHHDSFVEIPNLIRDANLLADLNRLGT